jgi:hypothetical protein
MNTRAFQHAAKQCTHTTKTWRPPCRRGTHHPNSTQPRPTLMQTKCEAQLSRNPTTWPTRRRPSALPAMGRTQGPANHLRYYFQRWCLTSAIRHEHTLLQHAQMQRTHTTQNLVPTRGVVCHGVDEGTKGSNGYKCQPEHHCRCRQTQYTQGPSPSAHPPPGAQLCPRHGSTAAYTLDTPTNYIRHGLTATHRLHTTTTPPKPRKPSSTSRLTHAAYPGNPGKHNLGPSPATTVYKTPLACHLAANCCGGSTGLRPRSHDKGTPES